MKKNFRAALALLALLSAADASAQSFEAWTTKAKRAEKAGELGAAIDAYSRALGVWRKTQGKAPKAQALAARAALYDKTEQLDLAVADLDEAIKLEPKRAQHFYRRGSLHLRAQNPAAAISDFYKTTALQLNHKEAYFERGLAYELQGDLKFAREDYKQACKLGLKKACPRAKAPAAPKADGFEAASGEERQGPLELRRKSVPKKKVDFGACLNGLDRCLEEGGSYGNCVREIKSCESDSAKGCCPVACIRLYERIAAERGEGAAYRETFEPEGKCALADAY